MFVVLELTGGVALYSGPQLVSKVFMPGVPAPQVPSLSSHSLLSSSSAASPLSTQSENSFKYRFVSLHVMLCELCVPLSNTVSLYIYFFYINHCFNVISKDIQYN
jgi:hypothetical protein